LIVDTSALLAILANEEDATIYAQALRSAPSRRISSATLVELYIVMMRKSPASSGDLDEFLAAANLLVEPLTARQADLARIGYRRFGRGSGHGAHLNFGDTFAYALATDLEEPLLFKGQNFARTDVRSALA
jgi:ribonuclease VapC